MTAVSLPCNLHSVGLGPVDFCGDGGTHEIKHSTFLQGGHKKSSAVRAKTETFPDVSLVTDTRTNDFTCKFCESNFKRRSNLRVHLLRHRFNDTVGTRLVSFFGKVGAVLV